MSEINRLKNYGIDFYPVFRKIVRAAPSEENQKPFKSFDSPNNRFLGIIFCAKNKKITRLIRELPWQRELKITVRY